MPRVPVLPRHRDPELEDRVVVRLPLPPPHQPDLPEVPEPDQDGDEEQQRLLRLPLLPLQF